MMKKVLSLSLALITVCGVTASISGCTGAPPETTDYKLAENIEDGSILHCFSWDFETIKNSMADIAAAGFTALQTSPVNECLAGDNGGMQLYGDGKWYYHYQPTDWTIGNYQLGTKEQFKDMCNEADKYGVKVIVDVVPNHTTPTVSAVNDNLIDAAGGMDKLYHQGSQYDLRDFSNRLDCTTYKMGGLPDVNTENPAFQDYFIQFLNDCIDSGADGFRYDTAKHIGLPDDPKEDDGFTNNFWERVITEVHNADEIFNYGEVLQGNNDRIKDYIKTIGKTTASTYGSKIRSAVMQGNLSTAMFSDYFVSDENLDLVTWVESHDNYINDGNWASMSEQQVLLGYAILAAREGGTPLLFDRPYGATTENQWGTMNRIGAAGSDMYKSSLVRAVNFFRIAMKGEEENLKNIEGDSTAVIIERGKKGAVIVNTNEPLTVDFDINLPDGNYTDRVDGKTVYTVKGGKLRSDAPIAENSAVVLYNEGYVNYAPTASVSIDDVECNYSSDSLEVTLRCSNTEKAQYTLDTNEAVTTTEFTDGTVVTIKPNGDGITKLTLTAESESGQKTYRQIIFTHEETEPAGDPVKAGAKVYFEKPENWSDALNAYVYEKNGGEEENSWPGFSMQEESNGRYSYTLKNDFDNPLIIFNDGTNQYPAANEPGLVFEEGKTYTING